MIDKYVEYIKQNIKHAHAFTDKLEPAYKVRLWAIFILNALGIIGFAILKENFPLPIFLAIFAGSACLLFDMLWNINKKNITDNFPNNFETEIKKHSEPQHCFKCRLVLVGDMLLRGFGCRIYVYKDVLLIKYGKNCLVIDNTSQIILTHQFLWCICKFNKGKAHIHCSLNKNQTEIIKSWIRAAYNYHSV